MSLKFIATNKSRPKMSMSLKNLTKLLVKRFVPLHVGWHLKTEDHVSCLA